MTRRVTALALAAAGFACAQDWTALLAKSRVVDLTVTVSETLPANWADLPRFQRWTYNWFVPMKNAYGQVIAPSEGPYYGQRYIMLTALLPLPSVAAP